MPKDEEPARPRGKVINLMDALRRSVAGGDSEPAEEPAAKPAARPISRPAAKAAGSRGLRLVKSAPKKSSTKPAAKAATTKGRRSA